MASRLPWRADYRGIVSDEFLDAIAVYEALGGKYARERHISIGGVSLYQVAYGCRDLGQRLQQTPPVVVNKVAATGRKTAQAQRLNYSDADTAI